MEMCVIRPDRYAALFDYFLNMDYFSKYGYRAATNASFKYPRIFRCLMNEY